MRYKNIHSMLRYADGGEVDDTSLDPQSSAIAAGIRNLIGDKPDVNDTQGIQPVASPIDLASGMIGGELSGMLSPEAVVASKEKALAQLINPADDLASVIKAPSNPPTQNNTPVVDPNLKQLVNKKLIKSRVR